MFHAGACRVFRTFFFTHRHPSSTNPAHPVSVPIHPIDEKSSAVTSSETDIYIYIANTRYQVHTYTYGVYSCVWRLGCFPGAWRRGSWHFQVASLHLQSSMDLFLSASHYFSFLSKRSGRRMPPVERSALYRLCIRTCFCVRTSAFAILHDQGRFQPILPLNFKSIRAVK